jgi:hypothetical protein
VITAAMPKPNSKAAMPRSIVKKMLVGGRMVSESIPKLRLCLFEDEPGRRSAAKLLGKDEARRIASNIAKLPELPWR